MKLMWFQVTNTEVTAVVVVVVKILRDTGLGLGYVGAHLSAHHVLSAPILKGTQVCPRAVD